jgi:hypothetical protein
MRPKSRTIFGEYGTDIIFEGFELSRELPEIEKAEARELLAKANARCPKDIAAKAVAVLRARTKARAEQSDDLKLLVSVFAEDLQRYPADIVISACREWGENQKWFPSWSELKERCESKFERRSAMQDALE